VEARYRTGNAENITKEAAVAGLEIRRVVTGHDENGRAIVKIDERTSHGVTTRPGCDTCVIWSTNTLPADNNDETDGGKREVSTAHEGGSVFRVIRYMPGVIPRNHRTDSIDYAVILSGEIVMQLDDSEVTLRAGDVLVQRGTIHNWVNRGPEPCVIAFVLIAAPPVKVGGKVLHAEG
jgi:quercetin dioxygenase-like cupin family protein